MKPNKASLATALYIFAILGSTQILSMPFGVYLIALNH